MALTNKIKFMNQEKTTASAGTTSTDWTDQGVVFNASELVAGHKYLMISWFNCKSPGSQEGGTRLIFDGGSAIPGSDHQRHDTNNNFMAVQHIGEFTAPDPAVDIVIQRRVLYSDSETEQTDLGQVFVIDLDHELVDGTDYSSSEDTSTRTGGANYHIHTVDNTSGTMLILATARVYDQVASEYNTLLGLSKNYTGGFGGDVELARASKFAQDAQDQKEIAFAAVANLNDGSKIKIKNLDESTTKCDYSYVFTLNIDDTPSETVTGLLPSWTHYGADSAGSGTWGTTTVNGNDNDSFVIVMGRQTTASAYSGKMAAVSIRNNTTNEWLLFKDRVEGDFDSGYFPGTDVQTDNGQLESSVIVGVGEIGGADEIEIVSL